MKTTGQRLRSRVSEQQHPVVLIIDDQTSFAHDLGRSFSRAGWEVWVDACFTSGLAIASDLRPNVIVSELRVGSRWIFDVGDHLRSFDGKVAVTTAFPSVASAIRVVREGIGAYLTKPVTAERILRVLDQSDGWGQASDRECWPSLDRVIWEYINHVFIEAGSMSEAARRLHIDRRSLRRMLAKYPPAR